MKLASLLVLLLGLSTVQAGTIEADSGKNPVAPAPDESIYDKIWDLAKIYKNDSNPIIEEFNLIGRAQFDYYNVNSTKGDNDYFEIRRVRVGADTFLAERHLELKAELDTSLRTFGSPSVVYNRFTNLNATFYIADEFNVRVGKFEPRFGYDREFSDTQQKFFERSFFDDQVVTGNDYLSGAEVTGKFGNFGYRAVVYSLNIDKEFGQFNGGQAYQAGISYDFSKALGADKALWVADYLHASGQNVNANGAFASVANTAATYLDYQKGKFCFVGQLGYDNQLHNKGDIYELMVMPSYLITEKFELVARYQLGLGTEANAITDVNRQTKTIGKFTGDTYNAGYVGLNYYLYGQKLKLMVGEQLADLTGGTGAKANNTSWTTLVGLRMYF